MDAAGLVTRWRDPDNRRVHQVELTAAGNAMFVALREKVIAFDERLRRDFTERDLAQLHRLLHRLGANVAPDDVGANE